MTLSDVSELIPFSKSTDLEAIEAIRSNSDKSINQFFSSDLPAALVVKYTKEVSQVIGKNESEKAILISILGHLHSQARMRPEVLAEAGCGSIGEYEKVVIEGNGASRSAIYAASTAFVVFPALTPSTAAKIGSGKLAIAARLCKEASPGQKERILQWAEEESLKGFKEKLEAESIIERGEMSMASFTLSGPALKIHEFVNWVNRKDFANWVESEDPLEMILSAFQHASSEFGGVLGNQHPREDENW